MSTELQWLRPQWLLALLPLALLWLWLVRRATRQRRWEDLVDAHLHDLVLSGDGGPSRRLPLLLLGLAWVLLVAALAAPAWRLASRPVYRVEQARVLVLDLSPSMNKLAGTATRLDRARYEVLDLLRAAQEGQVALIGFGAEPFLIAPLTSDAATIIEQVPVLAPGLLPVSGERRTAAALDMAAALLQQSGAVGGDVILISDGLEASTAERAAAVTAAARLANAGHRLSVLSIGDTTAFEPLAGAGGGLLLRARVDDGDTQQLIALQGHRRIEPAGDRMAAAGHWRDEGPWLLLLVLPLAALSFRRGWLGLLPMLCCLSPPAPAAGPSWSDLWLRPDQQALRALDAGHAALAGARFADPAWRAAAFYRGGQYQQALSELAGQSGAEAHYNRGNTLAHLGRYQDAIAEYDAALLVAPTHADARHNRDLLLRLVRAEPESAVSEASPSPRPGEQEESAAAGAAGGARADARDRSDQASGENGSGAATGLLPSAGDAAAPPGHKGTDRAKEGQRSGTESSMSGGGPPAENSVPQGDHLPAAGHAGTSDAQERADQGRSETGAVRAAPFTDRDREIVQGRADYLLRQVPDDPAGLLRERLMLQYLRRHGRLR